MNKDLQRAVAQPWDGADRTSVMAAPVSDEATPLLLTPVATLKPVPVPHLMPPVESQPGSWSGADVTGPLGASVPLAHQHITAQFAPFAGRAAALDGPRKRPTQVAVPSEPSDAWHLSGRVGTLTGQAFGDYELGGILGEGGMGVIYRARQRSLGRRVAVKTLSGGVGQDPIQRGRFELEARAAGLIRSPHVVQVHAAGSHNDTAYFVMEFVDGHHLGEILSEHAQQQQVIATERVVQWMLHAARGLAAAAQHGIVHRDIKPSNLLISHEVLKIADFGISRIQGESQLTRTGTAIGTPSYVSPEQGRGEVCDARSDLYSLGVVFYECLTGQKPFIGDTANAVIYQHCYSEPRLPREIVTQIPEHWQAVIMRCLQKSPDKRYQSASELVAEIERIQSGNVSLTAVFNARYGTGADEAMRRYQGRGRRWIAPTVAASLLATIAVLGAGGWWMSQANERAAARRAGERLRGELRHALDVVAPLPVSALADIDRLAGVVGSNDPDVLRWRAYVLHIHTLLERCGKTDQAVFLEAAVANQTRADLDALTTAIGSSFPAHQRWKTHLAENDREIQRLRALLSPLDASPVVSQALQAATAGDRARYASLAGAQDADLVRWTERIQSAEVQQAQLQQKLRELDDPAVQLTEVQFSVFASQLHDYQSLCGSDRPTVESARWRAILTAHEDRLRTLRVSLSRLDDASLIARETLVHIAKELAVFAAYVAPGNPDTMRWNERLVAHRQALEQLQIRCAALDQAADLNGEQLTVLRQDIDQLRPLVPTDDPQLRQWHAVLLAIETGIREDHAAVALLEREDVHVKPPLTVLQQGVVLRAIAQLEHRLLLHEKELIGYRQHLLIEQQRFLALKNKLHIADSPDVELTTALVDDVLLYGRLAGTDDPDYRRWYAQVVRAVQLREALSVLDGPHPVPDHARELLAEYNQIFGEDDRRAVMWRSKIDRVNQLSGILQVLDQAAEAPADGAQRLAELLDLVGPFPGSEAWRVKLAHIATLHHQLTSELGPSQVLLSPLAKEHLTDLGVLEGVAGVAMSTWTKRMAWLAGPGRPSWATGYRVDAHGPCAEIRFPGEPTLLITCRYLPPSTSAIGSPFDEVGRERDEAQVVVTRTSGCWLADVECNQALYARIMDTASGVSNGSRGPSSGFSSSSFPSSASGADLPVERVSWNEATAFCVALRRYVPGFAARLPREAEWEHAARAGSMGPWHGPRGTLAEAELDLVAWCVLPQVGSDATHPGARRKPNQLGLYDMHGNVWEWCEDRYGPYSPVPITDPLGIETDARVARGGSWGDPATAVRVANRLAVEPTLRSAYLGFRIACTADVPPEVRLEQGAAHSLDAFDPLDSSVSTEQR